MQQQDGTSTPRAPALDTLRGCAILLVVCYHFIPPARADWPAWLVWSSFRLGWVGVDLFFVLSGFLITQSIRRESELEGATAARTLCRFLMRRGLRTLPLYYVSMATLLCIAALLRAHGTNSSGGTLLTREQLWYWMHGANAIIATKVKWSAGAWTEHYWSLAVEEQFYLVWALVMVVASARHMPAIAATTGLAAIIVRVLAIATEHKLAAYVLMPSRADALLVGALLAVAARDSDWRAGMTRAIPRVLLVGSVTVGVLLGVYGPRALSPGMATVGYTAVALVMGGVLWLSIDTPLPTGMTGDVARRWRRWLAEQRWLQWLARYSYGVYIVHVPLRVLIEYAGWTAGDLSPLLGWWAATIVSLSIGIALSLLIAVPSWHLLEEPIRRRGVRFVDERLPAQVETRSTVVGFGLAAPGK